MTTPRSTSTVGAIRANAAPLFAFVAAILIFAPPLPAQSDGHSYLRMEISGRPITNLVADEEHRGWLGVLMVRATLTPYRPHASEESAPDKSAPGATAKKLEQSKDHWKNFSTILHSGHARAGKIRFGAGDDGGLAPLLDAQKHNSLIASADLDLFNENSGAFIGRYRLKGIRILSLEDVPASACAMYEITMSFQSAEKVRPE
ncbi:MAG: hypothetical protein ACRD59_18790 [Candidatus Acidiferrales bacterium]